MITQLRLRELVNYNPETGLFTWRANSSKYPVVSRKREGQLATQVNGYGYNQLYLDGQKHPAGQMAWLYMTGELPVHQIDHANQTRGDDRWINLREASAAQNAANRTLQTSNKSGCRGVFFQQGKWLARITHHGVVHNLGLFTDYDEAVAARQAAAIRFHGEFASLDKPLNTLAI